MRPTIWAASTSNETSWFAARPPKRLVSERTWLAGRKIAIVHDQPGITRDRIVAECQPVHGEPFEIIDTGGIGAHVDGTFSERVHLEAEIALASAAVVLFVVDGRAGLTPVDAELARQLRRADKQVLLVINKIDEDMHIPHEGGVCPPRLPGELRVERRARPRRSVHCSMR